MSNLSVNIQQRFTNLRKKLDQLGYMQPLSIDCLPLVENIFTDFVWTTDSFRKCKIELDKRMNIREKLEDYIEPYKNDNGRLLSENSRLQKKIIELKIEYEERARDLHHQLRHFEEEKEDLRIFNIQCLEKLKKNEVETKLMVDKITKLQEKNFQAVVHIPEGKRKQIPFRRQRMDIDFLVPRTDCQENTQDKDQCLSDRDVDKAKPPGSLTSEKADLLESVTNKCQELTKQLKCVTEELELSERKIQNYSEQVTLYEEEIQRLNKELSGGRSIEALTIESQQKSRDRIYEQLTMQMDLLQQRNEELEKEVIRCNALNIKEGKIDKINNVNNNNSIQYRKLMNSTDDLIPKEKNSAEFYEATSQISNRKDDYIQTLSDNFKKEISSLQCHIKCLEKDVAYWKNEAEQNDCDEKVDVMKRHGEVNGDKMFNNNMGYGCRNVQEINEKSITVSGEGLDWKSNGIHDTSCDLKMELEHCQSRLDEMICENDELKRVIDRLDRNPPTSSMANKNYEAQLKKVRTERDALQNLLDKFERQLHDIQGNIRVLTQERDAISERYEQCQRELQEMRVIIVKNEKPGKDNQQSLSVQAMLRRLEMEKDDLVNNLRKMATERDLLGERLKILSDTSISEKARLHQKLEEYENQVCCLTEEREEFCEKITALRIRIGEFEELNHQLSMKNESFSGILEKERAIMQKLNYDVEKYQNEMIKMEQKELELSGELKSSEQRISNLQERLQSQGVEMTDFQNECIKLKGIINELDMEKDQMQLEVDEKHEQLKDTQLQLKVKEDAVNELRMKMSSLEQQLKRFSEINNHRDQEARALLVYNEQLENDMRRQVSQMDQMKAENTRLEEDLMVLTRQHHKLESEFKDCQRCINEVSQTKQKLELQLTHVQQTESNYKSQQQELLEQYRFISMEKEQFQVALEKMKTENEELQGEIAVQENVISRLREQLLQADREINSSQSNVRFMEEQIRNLNQVMENNEQSHKNHSVEKNEIIRELESMRNLCTRLENSKENMQKQLSSRLLEVEQMKAENSGLYKENESLHEEIESMHENLRNMETVMSIGREKMFMNELETQQKLSELESENEHLAKLPLKINDLQDEVNKLTVINSELEAECDRIRRQLTSEKFKVELANQELKRRPKKYNSGSVSDRGPSVVDICDPNQLAKLDCYSSSSGVHTGRSCNVNSLLLPRNNTNSNNNASTSEGDTRIPTDRTDDDPHNDFDVNIEL